MGGLHGNWALVLLLYAALLLIALVAHLVWLRGVLARLRRSPRPLLEKVALAGLAAFTPVIGFYVQRVIAPTPDATQAQDAGLRHVLMPAIGAAAVLACAASAVLAYIPSDRTWSTAIGFIPSHLALYVAMHLILFMAASVFGLARQGVLATRMHLVSAAILLVMCFVVR